MISCTIKTRFRANHFVRNFFRNFLKRFRTEPLLRNFFYNLVERNRTKPFVRNLFLTCTVMVWYETFCTESLFELFGKLSIRNLNYYETKKGSSRVSRGRTFFRFGKVPFFLECILLITSFLSKWIPFFHFQTTRSNFY